MKKTVTILIILVIAVIIGFSFTKVDDTVTDKLHPRKYAEYVEKYSEEYGVPEEILYAVIKSESNFTADAVSDVGAIGLMQLMPETFEWICSKTGDESNTSFLYDPEVNIKCGAYYLSYLYAKFSVWETTYAAYNAGEGNVREWLANEEYGLDGRLVEIPFEETAGFVKRVSENAEVYRELLDKEKASPTFFSVIGG